jgi:predicted GIY-YIG superfamily endonuclease
VPFEAASEVGLYNMYYVYFIKSINNPNQTYIGYTTDLQQRLDNHNSGGTAYTRIDRPWKLVIYIAFDSKEKAIAFEKYIKAGSGHAFAKKRFW